MEPETGSNGASIEGLSRRISELECRVAKLEWKLESEEAGPAETAGPESVELAASSLPGTGQLAPPVGKALVGLAGAYALRAFTATGALPVPAGVALGLLYAAIWLFMASRTTEDQRAVTIIRGSTASLILIPCSGKRISGSARSRPRQRR